MFTHLVVAVKGAKGSTELCRFHDVTYQQLPHTLVISDLQGNTLASFSRAAVKVWWFEPERKPDLPPQISRAA
jgi:hypothetical protein